MSKTITVWGSPGSGKSMFCCILAKALTRDRQKAIIINADPGTPMPPPPMEWIRHFDQVRKTVFYFLINYDANRDLLAQIPHFRYLDMAIVFGMKSGLEDAPGTITVFNSHLDMWGITAEELLPIAEANTPLLYPLQVSYMPDLVPGDPSPGHPSQMYVLTNSHHKYGAAAILYKDTLKGFSLLMGSDVLLFPDSIHILAWIALHGLAEPTGRHGCSGYCRYPEYRFRPEVLQELDPEGYSEYLHGYEKRYGRETGMPPEKAVFPGTGVPVFTSACTFKKIFQETHKADGHTARFPVSEIAYSRSDYDGHRWWSTWFPCRKERPAAYLAAELSRFQNALFKMPEFESLTSMEQLCRLAEATADSGEYNLYSETEHFHVWLRMITRPRDYNLYVHYFMK